jgi:hypothetical protein
MIHAKNVETARYLSDMKRREQEDKERRRQIKKDRKPMRLARVVYHRNGAVTRIWRWD